MQLLKKIKEKISSGNTKQTYDLVCICNSGTADWIFGTIAREVSEKADASTYFYVRNKNTPPPAGRAYYYVNWYNFVTEYNENKLKPGVRYIIHYTHPRDTELGDEKMVEAFNAAHKISVTCTLFRDMLARMGVSPHKLQVTLGAADPKKFYAHTRTGNGVVGFVSAYYERKNPELIISIIMNMPHRQFLLLGKDWDKSPYFQTLMSMPNLRYVEGKDYNAYPSYYNEMDVFVSPSFLEGGPIPLAEAMMANVFPISSITGHAPDLITHGKNGFLFDAKTAKTEEVCELIDRAFTMSEVDVRSTVEHLSWENYAAQILKASR